MKFAVETSSTICGKYQFSPIRVRSPQAWRTPTAQPAEERHAEQILWNGSRPWTSRHDRTVHTLSAASAF